MGIFSDLKRLFFVKKSVAKSAGEKIIAESKEITHDMKSEAKDAWERAKEKGNEILDDVSEKVNHTKDSTDEEFEVLTHKTGQISNPKTSTEIPRDSNEHLVNTELESDQGNRPKPNQSSRDKLKEDFREMSSNIGDQLADSAETVGRKVHDIADKISEKASLAADRINEKLDEFNEKAERMKAEEDVKDSGSGFADTRHDQNEMLTKSNLEKEGSFFEKAEKFLKDAEERESREIKPGATTANSTKKKAYGFEDLDGDGNEIVDDAIIDDESSDTNDKGA